MQFAKRLRTRRYHEAGVTPMTTAPATTYDAMYLGTAARPWLAYRHPGKPDAGTALVIVPPFGHEALNAYRSLRALAEAAAQAGLDAWRIDLDGTGDSAGDDRDPDRVRHWLASITATVEAARAYGATRVILVGVRLGATLAAQVAADHLIAIAPVVAGKKWLREMRALQGALGLPPAPATAIPFDGDEALGFAISPQTREALTVLDLEKAAAAPAHVFVIDRDDMPASTKWLDKLRALGSDVTHARIPGYVEMVMDPHKSEIPTQIIAAVLERAVAWAAGTTRAAATPPVFPRTARFGDVIEEPVSIAGLAAVVSRPAKQPRPQRALLILNAGAVRRVGPNRMFVTIARRIAADGALVVRADLPGLGDSQPAVGDPDRVVYFEAAEPAVSQLVAWCRAAGATKVVPAGLCSGGYYALRSTLGGDPVAAMIAINPGTPDLAGFQATVDAERYNQSVRDPEKWKKLLRGGVDMRRLTRSVVTRARELATARVAGLARKLGRPLAGDLGADLMKLIKRGVTPTYVLCVGDPQLTRFREMVGPMLPKLEQAGLTCHVIEGPDHTFTPLWSQDVLADQMAAALRRL
ncbi:MAG: alpha/beta fold hydrolase [Kofleriaceae bacterium]